MINRTMAERLWPDSDAVGRRFRLPDSDRGSEWFTVIGVAADLRLFGVDPSDSQPPAYALVPYAHQQMLSTGVTIRVAGEPTSITAATRAEIRASDPNIATYWVLPMEDVRRVSFWHAALRLIFGTIGVVGLLLASVGVCGVLHRVRRSARRRSACASRSAPTAVTC